MKTIGFALAVVLVASTSGSAQVIHDDPQKASYADPSEWPTTSGQCHWTSPTANMPGMPAHTHVDYKFPSYAEVSQPITIPVTITLFHTAGRITAEDFNIFYAPTGFIPDTPFPWVGDINGIKVYTGKVTFDPRLSNVTHGWHRLGMQVTTHYDNSRELLINKFFLPVYNVTDLSIPEQQPGDGTGIRTLENCEVRDYSSPPNSPSVWQSNVMEFLQILPNLGPISPDKPWKLWMNGYNYGATTNLPPGMLRVRVDPDLHNNIPGTIIFEQQGNDTTIQPYSFPNLVPDGVHKVMFQWDRPDNQGTRQLTSIIVIPNFTVGAAGTGAPQPPNNSQVITSPSKPIGPPPTTCQDPNATNVGGPLPCVYPPPPCGSGGSIDVPFLGFVFRLTVDPSCRPTAVKL